MATDYSAVPFGVSGTDKTVTGRTTNNTTNVAILKDADGKEVFARTHGGHAEIQEDAFLATASATNEATPGQASADKVTGAFTVNESNEDYTRVSRTITKLYPSGSSSGTGNSAGNGGQA